MSSDWRVDVDGVGGRVLVIPAGGCAEFPIAAPPHTAFTGRVALLPHDWRDRTGCLSATVSAETNQGVVELWAGTLRSGDHGPPRGYAVDRRLPSTTRLLRLSVSGSSDRGAAALARLIWVEPALNVAEIPELTASREEPPVDPVDRPAVTEPGAPVISVLVPIHDPPRFMLEEAIASVREQTYPHWELCLVDDGSSQPKIAEILHDYARCDSRIRLTRHHDAQGISAATNAALAMARGTYIALLDHDDTLAPDALAHVARTIATQPALDMIYTDEDIVADGRRVWLHHKPGWSPDTLRTNGYTCHLGVYRRDLVREIGGFRSPFDGSQDVDMILRLTERTDRIAHIPRVLYHWRAHASSTAGGEAKPYAYVAARNAIADHADRMGFDAEVGFGPPGLYRFAHRVAADAEAEIILAVAGPEGIATAARSWSSQRHPAWRVRLAAPADAVDAVIKVLRDAGLPDDRWSVMATREDELAVALAALAADARTDHLLLMQSPAIGLTRDWLTRLIGYSGQAGVGAAGPVVLAPDGRIQQAGVALPEGIPLHLLHGTRSSMDDLFGYGTSVYNVSAVSGVLATSRTMLKHLGGLDPEYGELTLIEYCLRASLAGQRIVVVPDARLCTTGLDPTTNDLAAIRTLRETWAENHGHDPYYNPNYRSDRGDFTVARP